MPTARSRSSGEYLGGRAMGSILSLNGPSEDPGTVQTLSAFDARLLAHATHPLLGAGGCVACLASLAALESPRVHIVAASKERPEQGDLRFRRRSLIDRPRDQVHDVDLVCSARRNAAWVFSLHTRVRGRRYHSVAYVRTLHRTPEFLSEGVTTRVCLS